MRQQINGHTRLCGLIGNPVEHTMSPAIHNTLAAGEGRNLVYVPFHVEKGHLKQAVEGAYGLNVLGLNVTVPYKGEVIPFLKEIDEMAEKIGAVNTLVRTSGGFKGYNTDMMGLYRAMCSEHIEIEGEEIILLGAGGAARAVAFMCASKGAKRVWLLNRTLDKAKEVAEEVNQQLETDCIMPLAMEDYKKLPKDRRYLAIQATSVGLYPKVDEVVITDADFYQRIHTGFDLIYKPLETRFMSLVRAAGGRAFHGLKMLLYQGIIAYELWNQVSVSEEEAMAVYGQMKQEMGIEEKEKGKRKNIILIGFMGSGKTSVGVRLSYRLRRTMIDTDKTIERQNQMTISQIFERLGEEEFRQMETRCLERLLEESENQILSMGGGLPLKEENRRLLKQLGTVVYFRVTAETICARLADDTTRPLLQGDNPQEKVRTLLDARSSIYESAADIIIDVDNKDFDTILDEIIEKVGEE